MFPEHRPWNGQGVVAPPLPEPIDRKCRSRRPEAECRRVVAALVIALPHIGASTEESEENCAVMAADQLVDYLEHGHITNSVNYPAVRMDRTPGATRITFANDNVAGVLGHVLSVLADAKVNVIDMSNRSRDALAYNIIDVATRPQDEAIRAIGSVAHVIRVRVL